MAVWVHKDGESFLIQPSRLQQHLQAGYSTSKEPEAIDGAEESLREEAKEKGIKGYQRMKVETLKEKLGYDS